MKRWAFFLSLLLAFLALVGGRSAWAEDPVYWEPGDQSYQDLLTPEELDDLLAPIALYPDPLLAQILPAATFVDQVDEAARYVRQYGSYGRVDEMPWDISVRAVAHYPNVLFMMDQRYEWTAALGQAYINQPQDVMDAIQRLRALARGEGNLYSTAQQQVIYDDDVVRIVPATPQYVYLPVYDPDIVYAQSYDPGYPFVTFSTGFVIGAWLNRDCDWHRHRIYYHGWRGGGWVGRTRPHIHDKHGHYINRRAATINVNDRVLQHDTRRYREQLRTDSARWAERRNAAPATRSPGTRQPAPGTRQVAPGTRQTQQTTRGTRQTRQTNQGTVQQRTFGGRERSSAAGGAVSAPAVSGQPSGTRTRPSSTPSTRQQGSTTTRPQGSTTTRQQGSTTRRQGSTGATPATTAPTPAVTLPGTTAPAPAPVPRQPSTVAPQRQPSTAAPQRTPTTTDVFRGRDVQKMQPLSNSGYGGYGSSRDANSYRHRGESSRDTIRRVTPAAPHPRPASPSPGVVAPSTPRSVAPVIPSSPAPRAMPPATAPAPRMTVTPAPAPAPRPVSPAPAPAPRPSVTPAPAAPMSRPSFSPSPAVPMSRPSVTVPSSPSPMGRPAMPGRR